MIPSRSAALLLLLIVLQLSFPTFTFADPVPSSDSSSSSSPSSTPVALNFSYLHIDSDGHPLPTDITRNGTVSIRNDTLIVTNPLHRGRGGGGGGGEEEEGSSVEISQNVTIHRHPPLRGGNTGPLVNTNSTVHLRQNTTGGGGMPIHNNTTIGGQGGKEGATGGEHRRSGGVRMAEMGMEAIVGCIIASFMMIAAGVEMSGK